MTGIISMEDILEEIVGREIMDESDKAKNMRELARHQYRSASTEAVTQMDKSKEDLNYRLSGNIFQPVSKITGKVNDRLVDCRCGAAGIRRYCLHRGHQFFGGNNPPVPVVDKMEAHPDNPCRPIFLPENMAEFQQGTLQQQISLGYRCGWEYCLEKTRFFNGHLKHGLHRSDRRLSPTAVSIAVLTVPSITIEDIGGGKGPAPSDRGYLNDDGTFFFCTLRKTLTPLGFKGVDLNRRKLLHSTACGQGNGNQNGRDQEKTTAIFYHIPPLQGLGATGIA
jgi:hypothetical protein